MRGQPVEARQAMHEGPGRTRHHACVIGRAEDLIALSGERFVEQQGLQPVIAAAARQLREQANPETPSKAVR